MRFTPALFVGVAAAAVMGGDDGWGDDGWGTTTSTTSTPSTSSAWYYPSSSSSVKSSSSSTPVMAVVPSTSSAPWYPSYTTSTIYSTSTWSVSSKVYSSVVISTTVCPYEKPTTYPTASSVKTSSTPVKPVIPSTTSSIPYCSAYTETCTVTVTASSYPVKSMPVAPVYPVTSSTKVYPVYGSSAYTPYGTGSPVKPSAYQFTGAAVAQKAGAVLAGAGAVAAMLL